VAEVGEELQHRLEGELVVLVRGLEVEVVLDLLLLLLMKAEVVELGCWVLEELLCAEQQHP
jgi:hypothetical protein